MNSEKSKLEKQMSLYGIELKMRLEDEGQPNIRYFSIGSTRDDKFTEIVHDYTGGGNWEEVLVHNNCVLPREYEDGELVDWDASVELFNEFSNIKYEDLDNMLGQYADYDTEQFNYIANEDVFAKFDGLIAVADGKGIYGREAMENVPYGFGNTSFPNNGNELTDEDMTFEEFYANANAERVEKVKKAMFGNDLLLGFKSEEDFFNQMDELREEIKYLDGTINSKNIMLARENTILGIEDENKGKLVFIYKESEERNLINISALDKYLSVPMFEREDAEKWLKEDLSMQDKEGYVSGYRKKLLGKTELAEAVMAEKLIQLGAWDKQERILKGYAPKDMGNIYSVPKELQDEITVALNCGDIIVKGIGEISTNNPHFVIKDYELTIKENTPLIKANIETTSQLGDDLIKKLGKYEVMDLQTAKELAGKNKSPKEIQSELVLKWIDDFDNRVVVETSVDFLSKARKSGSLSIQQIGSDSVSIRNHNTDKQVTMSTRQNPSKEEVRHVINEIIGEANPKAKNENKKPLKR